MEPEMIARINELACLSKTRELTEAEQAERAQLRQAYIAAYRAQVEQQLADAMVREPDGTLRPLRRKNEPKS